MTYLSQRLGWAIPPPPQIESKMEEPKVEETVCLSGVGEMYAFQSFQLEILMYRSHMHFISKREKVKSEETSPIPKSETIKGDNQSVVAEPTEIEEEGAEGVLVDRPSKRVKV